MSTRTSPPTASSEPVGAPVVGTGSGEGPRSATASAEPGEGTAPPDEDRGDGRDLLLRNSVLLMITQVTIAGIGFVFWVAAARLFSASSVGLASTVLGALNLLSFLSLGGLNGTVVRFMGSGELRDRQVTQGVVGVSILGTVLGLGYALLAPLLVDRLGPVLGSPWLVLAFVLASLLSAVNLFTDSVFVGLRSPGYNVAIDGAIQSSTKLLALVVIGVTVGAGAGAVAGAWGMVVPTMIGLAVATVLSLLALHRRFGVRPSRSREPAFTGTQIGYSGGSYVASVFDIAPSLVVPLIVLQHHGDASSAYYFTGLQLATLVFGLFYAVSQSSLSEAASHPERFSQLSRRSARLLASVVVPGALGLGLVGPLLLRLFGAEYADQARELLVVLALTTLPVALSAWSAFRIRMTGQVTALMLSTVLFLATVVGLSLLWSDRDLVWIGWAWFVAYLVRAAVALVAAWRQRHHTGQIDEGEQGDAYVPRHAPAADGPTADGPTQEDP